MKIIKSNRDADKCCEMCKHYYQHYVKLPLLENAYLPTNDGYCICKRQKLVMAHWVCEHFVDKSESLEAIVKRRYGLE